MSDTRPARAHLRDAVFERDGGVCAICGANTVKMRAAYRAALAKVQDATRFIVLDAVRALRVRLGQLGFPPERDPWWEAHHVVPLAEGGADRLDNLATLCLPCHADETSALLLRLKRRQATPRGFRPPWWCRGVGRAPRWPARDRRADKPPICRVCARPATLVRGKVAPHPR